MFGRFEPDWVPAGPPHPIPLGNHLANYLGNKTLCPGMAGPLWPSPRGRDRRQGLSRRPHVFLWLDSAPWESPLIVLKDHWILPAR
jgi:hypothetical protein